MCLILNHKFKIIKDYYLLIMDDGNKFKVLKLEMNDIDFESLKIKVIITYSKI